VNYAGNDASFTLYDSRAAVFEKLGRIKEALQDSKQVIDEFVDETYLLFQFDRKFSHASQPEDKNPRFKSLEPKR